jgi:hypothetical protein
MRGLTGSVQQQFKCKLSGLSINVTKFTKKTNPDYSKFNASLDRIDSTKGYVEGNVQWVHRDIDKIKWKFEQSYFIKLCKKIAEYNVT